jgi:AAA+ ATPase superfamily predicted ATPase
MFYGRERERNDLERRYAGGKFECAVIYGRRRVGKTALINEFVKDKPVIFFTGVEGNERDNLESLSASIQAFAAGQDAPAAIYADIRTALEAAFSVAKDRRAVFVIDEFPYLAKSCKAVSSIIQILIDRNKENSKMFLILCGSSLSFMEEQVLGDKSPLYGRRTCQYKIVPFTFFEIRDNFPGFSNEDLAMIYGLTGGIPLYLSFMDDSASIADNIKNNFLDPGAFLFEEPQNLIKQECRDPARFNSVIRSIADGATKVSDIAGKTGLETSYAAMTIGKLTAIGIVRKETPYGEKPGRKSIYRLADSMFRFWYRFVWANLSAVTRGLGDAAYRRIEPHIPAFMGEVFEEISKQYLWEEFGAGKGAVAFTDIGRWGGNDSRRRQESESDIVGASEDGEALFAECKWTNEKADAATLNGLAEKAAGFPHGKKAYYVFSKSGFTAGCEAAAEALGDTRLLSLRDMLRLRR